jgi:hypothetical protein
MCKHLIAPSTGTLQTVLRYHAKVTSTTRRIDTISESHPQLFHSTSVISSSGFEIRITTPYHTYCIANPAYSSSALDFASTIEIG